MGVTGKLRISNHITKKDDENIPLTVRSDQELWGILSAMPTGAYTVLTNNDTKISRALYYV